MYYDEVLRKLNESKAGYLVAGGMAVNLHGVPRLTQDLDLLIDLGAENVEKVIRALLELGYRSRVPEDPLDFAHPETRERWKREKNMKVFSFFHSTMPFQEIDLMFDVPIGYNEAVGRRIVKKAGDLEIPLISIPDLIRLKEVVGRRHDISDIKMLKEIQKLEAEDAGT